MKPWVQLKIRGFEVFRIGSLESTNRFKTFDTFSNIFTALDVNSGDNEQDSKMSFIIKLIGRMLDYTSLKQIFRQMTQFILHFCLSMHFKHPTTDSKEKKTHPCTVRLHTEQKPNQANTEFR